MRLVDYKQTILEALNPSALMSLLIAMLAQPVNALLQLLVDGDYWRQRVD